MPAELWIADGAAGTTNATRIDLLGIGTGYDVAGWRQAIAQYKGGGTWQNSALAEGRRLVHKEYGNVVETFPLIIKGLGQDDAARILQDLLRLLEKAADYWCTDWQSEPVWIESRAEHETNKRYALVGMGSVPEVDDIYRPGFNTEAALRDLTLIVERSHWLSEQPGEYVCTELSTAHNNWAITDEAVFRPLYGTDDAYVEHPTGIITTGGSDIRFGDITATKTLDLGVRFQGVAIPIGATIISAFVRFTCAQASPTPNARALVKGEDTVTPVAFSTYADFVGRSKTTANVPWSPVPVWPALGGTHDTPDISSVVQEIVDRPDWTGYHNMVIFVEDNGSDFSARRVAASVENTQYNEAELHVVFTWNPVFGRSATCLDEVYIANHHNTAQLTHIFVDDGGVFGPNLLTQALPYNLFPAIPAINDAVYFGITNALPDTGAFTSVVFDLIGITDAPTVWERPVLPAVWNAMPAGEYHDNTAIGANALQVLGVNSLHWQFPFTGGWAGPPPFAVFVNGVNGYWIRCRVTGAGTTPATQQNRHPYTITWACVDIDSAQIGGDIPALAYHIFHDQVYEADWKQCRVLCGLRSLSRGENFSAYINLSNEQNPPGVTVTVDGVTCTFVEGTAAAATRSIYYNRPPDTGNFYVTFDSSIVQEYSGTYHLFLRGAQLAGAARDTTFDVTLQTGGKIIENLGTFYIPSVGVPHTFMLVDLGRIDFTPPQLLISGEAFYQVVLNFDIAGTEDVSFYDLILLPTDEWAGDFRDLKCDGTTTNLADHRKLRIDSIQNPKKVLRPLLMYSGDNVRNPFAGVYNGPAIYQANRDQRLWFLFARESDYQSLMFYAGTLQSFDVQRYLGMRGSR